ncbi:KICSTOR complex protein ITFG2-like isoform X3 [Bemisia tabaci]|uniref:KICSTOR complex protein ITFG2-like isoform X3 n=1 Tax=Bemisia tabaci TaxID=7038 RepID=UPI0008F9B830|nr:PREDICTED: integrin-alpha FG-GAP repeat-containing protein 2-like isoform X3 [Bemisia tabaci]
MRPVCFVKNFEIDFSGVVYRNAVILGDVNNDGNDELVIGNMEGTLCIYKGQEPIQTIKNLGLITAIGIGDIMNCGSNALVVVSGDGWCHIFLCLNCNLNVCDEGSLSKLECVHSQRVPPNTKALILGDVDNDGNVELVVGLTDRVVRSYRWVQNAASGKLVCLNKWECANQIGSITLNYNAEGLPCLLISQPGGTFMRIRSKTMVDPSGSEEEITTMEVDYHPLYSSQMRNPGISSEIVGSLKTNLPTDKKKGGTRYAVATLDGSLMLVQDEKVVWSLQVDHQLFALSKLDVTGDGQDEIIASSWDGQTYILDQHKKTVCFHIEESISGFCAGLYSLGPTETLAPCFIYTTFTNKVRYLCITK